MNAEAPRVEFERIDEYQSEFPQCDPRHVKPTATAGIPPRR